MRLLPLAALRRDREHLVFNETGCTKTICGKKKAQFLLDSGFVKAKLGGLFFVYPVETSLSCTKSSRGKFVWI